MWTHSVSSVCLVCFSGFLGKAPPKTIDSWDYSAIRLANQGLTLFKSFANLEKSTTIITIRHNPLEKYHAKLEAIRQHDLS